MIPFKGRSDLRVFMPSKPIRYGLKAYLLCEATTGYVINWSLHTGQIKASNNESITQKIVLLLCEGLEGENYNLFMDRFYTGLPLLRDLKEIEINACGTINCNRLRLDKDISESIGKLNDREILYFTEDSQLLLTIWKDNRNVFLLSNYHEPGEVEKERRIRKKDYKEGTDPKEKQTVNIPANIAEYNDYMRGVDHFDHLSSNYCPDIRSKRWYIKVFYHLLEISVINSYILYKQICQRDNTKFLTHLEYRKEIIRELLKDVRDQKLISTTPKKKATSSCVNTESSTDKQKITNISLSGIKKTNLSAHQKNIATVSKKITFDEETKANEKEDFTKKRKSETILTITLLNDCKLSEITIDLNERSTNRRICHVCKGKEKPNVPNKFSQTRYWCSIHKIPVCIIDCYDTHRTTNLVNMNNEGKFKKPKK